MSEDILSGLEGSIGVVTLNRPQSHNAITRQMWKSLPVVCEQLKKEGARTIVLSGQGDSFASGADLSQLIELTDHDSAADFWISIENCLHAVWQFELPIIAMIQGPCFGGGCLLATACDLRFAAKNSTFGIPSAHLGIVLDDASVARLVALVGTSFARRMLYTSATIYCEEAEKHGLIDKVFEAGVLRTEVMRIATALEHNDACAVSEAKRSINRLQMASYNAPCSINSDEQRQMIVERYQSPEFHQRVAKAIESLQ